MLQCQSVCCSTASTLSSAICCILQPRCLSNHTHSPGHHGHPISAQFISSPLIFNPSWTIALCAALFQAETNPLTSGNWACWPGKIFLSTTFRACSRPNCFLFYLPTGSQPTSSSPVLINLLFSNWTDSHSICFGEIKYCLNTIKYKSPAPESLAPLHPFNKDAWHKKDMKTHQITCPVMGLKLLCEK